MAARVAAVGDPWEGMHDHGRPLRGAAERLAKL
jgi:hypothetical protein